MKPGVLHLNCAIGLPKLETQSPKPENHNASISMPYITVDHP